MPALSLALLGRGTSANDGTGDTARDGALKLNRNARLLEALAKGAVISATTTAQPVSPSVGDLYIIPSGKTGTDWSAMTNGSLALYAENDGANAWFEITPAEGWRVYARDTNVYYYHNGSAWAALISTAMTPVVQAASTNAGLGAMNGVLEVATKAALSALTAGVVDAVYMRARSTAGDGGGGLFYWSASNHSAQVTLDTQAGIYVPPSSDVTGASGAWVRDVDGNRYHTEWFGVVADDGTDQYAKLAAAIAALPNVPCTLIVQSGAIELDGQLAITRGYLRICGGGSGATSLKQRSATANTIYIADPAFGAISQVTIANMEITTDTGVTSTAGAAIYAEKCEYLRLESLTLGNHFYNLVIAGGFNVHVHNCIGSFGFSTPSTRAGIVIAKSGASWGATVGGNFFFSNCAFNTATGEAGSPGAYYGAQVTACDGLFATNCYFGYFSNTALAIDYTNGDLITGLCFSNCWFDHKAGNGVKGFGSGGSAYNGGNFTGCVVVGGSSAAYNVWFTGAAQNVRWTGGDVKWCAGDNFRIDTTIGNFAIVGVNFETADDDGSAGGEGVNVVNGDDITISGNTINGSSKTDNGILISGGDDIVVTGNRVYNCVNGITTSGSVDGYIIAANNARGNSSGGVVDGSSGANKSVTGNLS